MHKVFIIAEAGVNHNGNMELAKKLILTAKESGADAVKFQTFVPENIVSRHAPKADYQKDATDASESQLEMLRCLTLSESQHRELLDLCREVGIQFLSTAFDRDSLALLERIGVPLHKIPSGEVTNLPLLVQIARCGKPVILSGGMCYMFELVQAVEVLREHGSGDITVLHCNTQYPTPFEDVNLNAMAAIRRELSVPVGYSDHTMGIEIPIAAAALGADVIEKHFTLNRDMEGPDHKASLEPLELKAMVSAIRHVESAMGSGEKEPSPSEKANITIARKSLVARRNIKKGEMFTEENLTTKRPGTGVSPMEWFHVIGKTSSRDFEEDELIEL